MKTGPQERSRGGEPSQTYDRQGEAPSFNVRVCRETARPTSYFSAWPSRRRAPGNRGLQPQGSLAVPKRATQLPQQKRRRALGFGKAR